MGLSDLNSGWICASLTAGLGGLDTSGIMRGAINSSSLSSSSISGRNGPSRIRAGVTDRLPGIGSNGVPLDGACITASRAWLFTLLVSQLSNPSEWDTLSIECASEQILLVSRLNEARPIRVERDVTGRTACRMDSRKDLSDCDEREEKVGEGRAPRLSSGEDG